MTKLPEGVYKAEKKDGTIYYRSSITYSRKHISLGSFSSPIEAHDAYLEASSIIRPQNSTIPLLEISDYKDTHILSFEKWVCLINFRDNHIYFSTPIFIRPKFFYYYLAPTIVLKFDSDDLFYFSSHKIMKRGGHYFVADFGMQVNILGRFGIKNYAVINRDYRFINGDTTDFRRENLEIYNQFHGVILHKKGDVTRYRARIHINGNYIIGTYNTMIEAAIAYNKAIDILLKAGIHRKYTPNYIEGLSPSAYADIYTKVSVSKKLYSISPNNQ